MFVLGLLRCKCFAFMLHGGSSVQSLVFKSLFVFDSQELNCIVVGLLLVYPKYAG